jgi:chromosomal replication initiator protein
MECPNAPLPNPPSHPGPPVTIVAIKKIVSAHFYLRELRDPDLQVRCRKRVFVLPRQVAIYLVKQTTAASLQEIGRLFGGRHHSTVLHSIRKIEGMRMSDEALNHFIMQFMDAVAN